jgi:ubiquitin carboxyl-terminal hydrolase L5
MNRHKEITLGQELENMRNFSLALPSREKGITIGNSDKIREAHNSFSRQDPFIMEEDDKKASKDDDAFQFISYVPFNGQLYELDGLQKGPISFGPCTEENWLGLARTQIQERIQKYATSEIRFNLLAVIGDKIETLQNKSTNLTLMRQWIQGKLGETLSESEVGGNGAYSPIKD